MASSKDNQFKDEEPLDDTADEVACIDPFASMKKMLEDNPEFKGTFDTVMSIIGDDPTDEEQTEVECCEIDGHDYIVAKRIEIAGSTYLYLVNEDDVMDFLIQKVVAEDGEEYITGLESEKEFDIVQAYVQRDFLKQLKEKLKKDDSSTSGN